MYFISITKTIFVDESRPKYVFPGRSITWKVGVTTLISHTGKLRLHMLSSPESKSNTLFLLWKFSLGRICVVLYTEYQNASTGILM